MAVYYITFGTFTGLEDFSLLYSPAAYQKGLYIIEKMDNVLSDYNVITMSETGKKAIVVLTTKTVPCGNHGSYTVWTTFGKPFRFVRKLHCYLRAHQLEEFLLGLGSDDTIIAYHSLIIADILVKIKNKKCFRLILELEEKYQDAIDCNEKQAKSENAVIEAADGFILSTDALSKIIPRYRPYIVINGTYKEEPARYVSVHDGRIHCVYAGTFDPIKGGATAAIAAAQFLTSEYHVHILGFGSEEQKQYIINYISEIQKKTSCLVTYDGLKSGEEYVRFLQMCHIGLCTQIPNAKYTETSFPSKILVYLANGLRVLSVRIPAIENSKVGELLNYYDDQTPEEIAKAIMNIDLEEKYDSRLALKKLDMNCSEDLKQLLEKVQHGHIKESESKR